MGVEEVYGGFWSSLVERREGVGTARELLRTRDFTVSRGFVLERSLLYSFSEARSSRYIPLMEKGVRKSTFSSRTADVEGYEADGGGHGECWWEEGVVVFVGDVRGEWVVEKVFVQSWG